MTRRTYLWWRPWLPLLGILSALHVATAAPPNIVLLESDQHQAACMSCMGHAVVKTPNLDALAARGVLFTDAICPSPVCQPSRVAVLTGRYPHQNGVYDNGREHPDTAKMWTFPRALQGAGYYTGFIGKTHLGERNMQMDCDSPEFLAEIRSYGFDSVISSLGKVAAGLGKRDDQYTRHLKSKGLYEAFSRDMLLRRGKGKDRRPAWYAEPSPLNERDFHDAWIGDQAVKWIREHQQRAPFFVWVNWGGPHAPWDAPAAHLAKYDPEEVDLPYPDPRAGYPPGIYSKPSIQYSPERSRRVRANYYALIDVIDAAVGRITAALQQGGLTGDTVVVYCSDHGEMLGDHGMYAKSVMYRQSVNVPLIIAAPGAQGGRRYDQPVNTLDLARTILEIAGIAAPAETAGVSLLPVLRGGDHLQRDAVFSEIKNGKQHVMMVQTARYKYVCCQAWAKSHAPFRALLFDRQRDPRELHNLSARPEWAAVEEELRRRVEAWQQQ